MYSLALKTWALQLVTFTFWMLEILLTYQHVFKFPAALKKKKVKRKLLSGVQLCTLFSWRAKQNLGYGIFLLFVVNEELSVALEF